MRDELAAREEAKYRKMWAVPEYSQRSPGERIAPRALEAMPWRSGETMLDLGAGTGRASLLMQRHGLRVTAVDHVPDALCDDARAGVNFVKACLWDLPPDLTADWGFCADVMEHIPTDMVGVTLMNIRRACRAGVFFQIATFPDTFGRRIGETLHETVRPPEWWRERLAVHWSDIQMDGDRRFTGLCR